MYKFEILETTENYIVYWNKIILKHDLNYWLK